MSAPADHLGNTWMKWKEQLAPAYVEHASAAGNVRFELVTRALTELPLAGPCRVVDVGGGFGRQAIMLARLGHAVTVLDPDQGMLDIAAGQVERENSAVRARIRLVRGDGENSRNIVGGDFDLVCCHSVLLYLDNPGPMIGELVNLARMGGWISVVALNAEAIAMRSGLQGKWRDALASMRARQQIGNNYLPVRADTIEDIERRLALAGARLTRWHGVGVFTDHRNNSTVTADFGLVCDVEWEAARRDPYRRVARSFHAIAQRGRDS